jgi:hypothetical protein
MANKKIIKLIIDGWYLSSKVTVNIILWLMVGALTNSIIIALFTVPFFIGKANINMIYNRIIFLKNRGKKK